MVLGQLPPNKLPPGQLPPRQLPPGQLPPRQLPTGQLPPYIIKKEKKEFKSCVGHQKCAKAYMVQSLMGPSLKSSVVVAFFVHVAWRQFLTIAF